MTTFDLRCKSGDQVFFPYVLIFIFLYVFQAYKVKSILKYYC